MPSLGMYKSLLWISLGLLYKKHNKLAATSESLARFDLAYWHPSCLDTKLCWKIVFLCNKYFTIRKRVILNLDILQNLRNQNTFILFPWPLFDKKTCKNIISIISSFLFFYIFPNFPSSQAFSICYNHEFWNYCYLYSFDCLKKGTN